MNKATSLLIVVTKLPVYFLRKRKKPLGVWITPLVCPGFNFDKAIASETSISSGRASITGCCERADGWMEYSVAIASQDPPFCSFRRMVSAAALVLV